MGNEKIYWWGEEIVDTDMSEEFVKINQSISLEMVIDPSLIEPFQNFLRIKGWRVKLNEKNKISSLGGVRITLEKSADK